MITQELLNYIKKSQTEGFSREQILATLQRAGWQKDQIEEVFGRMENLPSMPVVDTTLSPLFAKSTLVITGLFIGLLFIIGGAGAALYTGIYEPAWNPFRPNPQEVITEMTIRNKDIDFFELATSVEITTQTDNTIESLFKIETNELIDESNPEVPKSRASVLVTGKEAKNIFAVESDDPIQVIFIGRNFYQKISTSWIQLGPLSPLYSLLIPSDPLYSEGPALWFGDPQLYTVEEELFNERLAGMSVYHYRLNVDPRAALRVDTSLSESEDLSDSVTAELWIDKQSRRLLRFVLISKRQETTVSVDIKFSFPDSLDQPIELPVLSEEMNFTISLHPVGNSGQNGMVTFSKEKDGMKILLSLTGAPSGIEQEAYEFANSCTNMGKRIEGGTGGIISVLNPIIDGISITDRIGMFEDFLWISRAQQSTLFQHSIAVYKPNIPNATRLSDFTLVACGDIVIPERILQ